MALLANIPHKPLGGIPSLRGIWGKTLKRGLLGSLWDGENPNGVLK